MVYTVSWSLQSSLTQISLQFNELGILLHRIKTYHTLQFMWQKTPSSQSFITLIWYEILMLIAHFIDLIKQVKFSSWSLPVELNECRYQVRQNFWADMKQKDVHDTRIIWEDGRQIKGGGGWWGWQKSSFRWSPL